MIRNIWIGLFEFACGTSTITILGDDSVEGLNSSHIHQNFSAILLHPQNILPHHCRHLQISITTHPSTTPTTHVPLALPDHFPLPSYYTSDNKYVCKHGSGTSLRSELQLHCRPGGACGIRSMKTLGGGGSCNWESDRRRRRCGGSLALGWECGRG